MIPLILLVFLNTAFERHAESARATALAHAFTAAAEGVDAIRFNPAGLSLVNYNQLGVGYERPFAGIECLHNIGLAYARPMLGGVIGIELSEFGFSEQKEQAITLAYGTSFSDFFKIGLSGDIYTIDNARTGRSYATGLNIGFLAKLYRKWSLGVFGRNLNQPQFHGHEVDQLPPEIKAGLAYEPFDGILSEVDFSVQNDDFRVHVAGEFELFDILFLRTGVKSNPTIVSAGIGIIYKFINVDYAAELIPELPVSHIISLRFTF